MDAFITWKFLHIATMFLAVALALSGEIVLHRIADSGDVRAIRVAVKRVKPLSGTLATVLFLLGLAFGILAALAGQIDLLRPWLILAYIAFALAIVIGATIGDPWVSRLETAATESAQDAPSPELLAVIGDSRARLATGALIGLMVILVFIMVVKPLG